MELQLGDVQETALIPLAIKQMRAKDQTTGYMTEKLWRSLTDLA